MKQLLVPLSLSVLLVSAPLQANCYGELGGAVAGGVAGSIVGENLGGTAGGVLGGLVCGGSFLLAPVTFGFGPVIACTSVVTLTATTGRVVGGLGGGLLGAEVGGALGHQFDDDDCR